MQCCMPLCENTSENVSKCSRITFHRIPSEVCLRAAWLQALGKQDSRLPDPAVVCSQHFLHDDFCETESGSRQLRTDAVPSITVLVCIICLDTDSKMFPVSQYNLEEAYEQLTGHPLCDGGNLKQTLCVQCAQGLRNFSRFRDKSLRARSLLMELFEKHELITAKHIKMIRHANNQLRNRLVSTVLGPDHCDMYIKENCDNEYRITVKTECTDDSQSVDEDTQMINEENVDCGKVEITLDPLKYESTPSMTTGCSKEFVHEHAYGAHAGMQLRGAAHPTAPSAHAVVTPLLTKRTTNTGYEASTIIKASTTENSEQAFITNSSASDNRPTNGTNTDIKSSIVNMYYIIKYPQNAKVKVEETIQSLQAASSGNDLNAHTAARAKPEDIVATAHNEPAASTLSKTEPGTSGNSSRTRTFTCDVCQRAFTRKYYLVMHMMTHTGEKPYSCKICTYKSTQKKKLIRHMRTHTGEKPYPCEICSHKSTTKSSLNDHMRTHTGEKPFSCTICEYKCIQKGSLLNHMSTHTGEKPYSCEICGFKFAQKGSLVGHMRTHTGEKPYCCEVCGYHSASKGTLNRHVKRKHP